MLDEGSVKHLLGSSEAIFLCKCLCHLVESLCREGIFCADVHGTLCVCVCVCVCVRV